MEKRWEDTEIPKIHDRTALNNSVTPDGSRAAAQRSPTAYDNESLDEMRMGEGLYE